MKCESARNKFLKILFNFEVKITTISDLFIVIWIYLHDTTAIFFLCFSPLSIIILKIIESSKLRLKQKKKKEEEINTNACYLKIKIIN